MQHPAATRELGSTYLWTVADETVIRTYGRGSFLAFLAPLFAFLMARRGLNGWEQTAALEMQRDAQDMADRGYVVMTADEYSVPLLGITWFRVVYRRGPDRPA